MDNTVIYLKTQRNVEYIAGDNCELIEEHSAAGEGGEIPLASLGSYTQGDVVIGGAGDWEALAVSTAHHILKVNAGGTEPAWAAFVWAQMGAGAGADMVHDHSVNAEGGTHWGGQTQTFGGGTGVNVVTIPDHLEQAWKIVDDGVAAPAAVEYMRINTTNAGPSQAVIFNHGEVDVNFRVAADGITNALLVDGAAGGITVGGPSMTVPATWNLVGADNVADMLGIDDADGLEYLRIVSTDANPYFHIFPTGAGWTGQVLIGDHPAVVGVMQGFFSVYGTSDTASFTRRHSAAAAGATFVVQRSRNDAGADVIVQNGDYLGRFAFAGHDGVDFLSLGADIHCAVDAAPGANDMPGRLVFGTTWPGSNLPTEAMRINRLRDVSIGIAGDAQAQLDLRQPSETGAQPVALFGQADLSEEFFEFTTTVGAGNPIDTAGIGAYYGKARVMVTGVGYKVLALYEES